MNRLDTFLTTPEEKILKQGDKGDAMFFISQGDVTIDVRDQNAVDHLAIRLLVEGDHFGELSLLYRCPRTCSVISRNYNTMARLRYLHFREVTN